MSGYISDTNPSKLGGGTPGLAPVLLNSGSTGTGSGGMNGGTFRSQNRMVLRRAFGQAGWFRRGLGNPAQPLRITPFRQYMNAGDLNGTINNSPSATFPAPSQLNSVGISILNTNADNVRNNGNSAYSGNTKYVYDSSDYARYKRLKNINRNYNDSSFGGDQNNGSFSFLMRVRR